MTLPHFVLSTSILTLFLATGCDTVDKVDSRLDCNDICDRYASCFDDDYDVDECADNCKDAADDEDELRDKIDECDACIDDKSCSSATFKCADECAGIVP